MDTRASDGLEEFARSEEPGLGRPAARLEASVAAMHDSLEKLILLIERVAPGMRGSVLLLDEDGATLRHGAAPNLPEGYRRLIDGEAIGPAAGSCGTAAYRRERVIVRDIATDPLWANYRKAAEPFGLAACWSTPILNRRGSVLGTFAMYYDEPREPTSGDIELSETAALLAGDIISRARAVGALVAREEQLRSSEERLRALAESIPQLAWTADASGWIDWYNQRWYEYTGTTLEEMEGWGWRKVHHPDHLERVVERIRQSWDTGEPWEDTFPLRRRDGRYRWFLSRAQPVRDADGKIVRWFGTNTDITELREAEASRDAALADARAGRERLHEVFMQTPAAISVLEGPDHIFTVANPLYLELVGKREIVGKSVREALPGLEGQGFFELLDAVFASGEPYAAREWVVRLDRDGDGVPEELYMDFVYQPLKDGRGLTFGIMAHAVEVTEQVRARQEIDDARAGAEHANRAKSEFLAAMSHDLRTPLNAIAGYADLVEAGVYGPVTDDQRGALERIRHSGKHLLTLINDILSFARIEAGSLQLQITDVVVNEILATAESLIEIQAQSKGLSLFVHRGAVDVRVQADRERTIQILANLLTNAVKFTDIGSVTVDWHVHDHSVCIQVRDTGRGIPADRQAAIFQPFVQVGHSVEEQREGIGLGLAISRELARAMEGDLSVQSEVARGSTFTLALPRAAGE